MAFLIKRYIVASMGAKVEVLAHPGDKYCEDRQAGWCKFFFHLMLHHAPVIYYHIHAKSTHAFSGKCEIEVLMAFATAILSIVTAQTGICYA